jgi:hypothetical protein
MWQDPIVAEVHVAREHLAAMHGFDIKAIFADLRMRQRALGKRLVPPKRRDELASEADRPAALAQPSTPTSNGA